MSDDTRKSHPGWNDPPILDSNTNISSGTSRKFNKRVAFPLPSNTQTENISSVDASVSSKEEANPPGRYNVNESEYQEGLKCISQLSNKMSNDDKTKIEILKDLWKNGRLSEKVQSALYELFKCLVAEDFIKANEYHLKLMMDECCTRSSWISVIRTLINNSK